MVGEDGFEPSKVTPTDLQSAPFGHSGTLPIILLCETKKWSWWTDLNPRPADYKSAALPTELHQRLQLDYNIIIRRLCQYILAKFFKFPIDSAQN